MRNYFKGNTRARRMRIKKLHKKIVAKQWKKRFPTFFKALEK